MKKVLSGILILLLLAVSSVFKPVDFTPLEELAYVQQTLERLAAFEPPAHQDTVRGNWAEMSLLPPFPVAMAGYGDREGAPFEGIRDSLSVRAVVFHTHQEKYAWLSADLLIIPPLVYQELEKKLDEIGWNMQQVYLTATHTHGGPGGWQPGAIGKLFAGDFLPEMVDFLAKQFVEAIQAAEVNPETMYMADTTLHVPEGLVNRLVGEEGTIEPRLDLVYLKKASGAKALWYTYAAHATTLGPEEMRLHGDYPALTADALKQEADLISYAAGAVGSMGPAAPQVDSYANEQELSRVLAERIKQAVEALHPKPLLELWVHRFPLALGEPQWRVSHKIALRSWLFRRLFGEIEATLSVMRIGKDLWIGYPADISGELSVEWADAGRPVYTGFNGSYAGYFTHDRHYSLDSYETRMMNWFGPHKGAYMQQLAQTAYRRFGDTRP
jgi:hypothetical protein